MSFRSLSQLAAPSRSRSSLQIRICGYATQPDQPKSIGEMINRKAISSAWRALSPNQKLLFGGLVALGAYFEYSLLDRYVLGPIKARKEEERRGRLERDLKAAGGGEREVFLESS
ncbi:hypothetical protein I302_105962 [Kwoniella bestiolae CBS 10118]|uniref:Uncharacterized protein n=1 Tax=Kwoniella bestiolae CBS 10118 TaxID=1296100 RepID=A0A1B9G2M4_9TREE|nr:hypothetical protein I302_05086 [Kwoniella bestiolae CBS 10118]OCF25272.1 hypothetical protein I302_05086 [Kwoniella bestiolae CBS 10118]